VWSGRKVSLSSHYCHLYRDLIFTVLKLKLIISCIYLIMKKDFVVSLMNKQDVQ